MDERIVFPTRIKSKISSKLSYPVGAELISSELQDVPQAQSLEISFHAKYERMKTRREPYEILSVQYRGPQGYGPAWTITVRPIPRLLKHTVKETLRSEFFPRIRQWLKGHTVVEGRLGYSSISVIFDELHEPMLKLEESSWRSA